MEIKICLHSLHKIFPLNYFLHLKFSGGGENGGKKRNIGENTWDISAGLSI